jgi:hypothetical protein
MKKIVITMAVLTSMMMYVLSSCYKNKEDIESVPKVSFRSDVVPIVVSGGCGCHNNGSSGREIQFSHVDTVFYDAILARVGLFDSWVNTTTGGHPGGGVINFTPSQRLIVQRWIREGGKDDGGGCTVTGHISYNTNILPIYTTTCKAASCHEGVSVKLDYARMVTDKNILSTMMNSAGATGHLGPVLSLGTCTVNTFLEWIAQGQPQN